MSTIQTMTGESNETDSNINTLIDRLVRENNLDRVLELIKQYFHQAVHTTQTGLSHARQVIHDATEEDEEEKVEKGGTVDTTLDDNNNHEKNNQGMVHDKKLLDIAIDVTKTSFTRARRTIHNATKSVEEKKQEKQNENDNNNSQSSEKNTLLNKDEIKERSKFLLDKAMHVSKESLVRALDVVHEATRKEEDKENQAEKEIAQQRQHNENLLTKAIHATKTQLDHVCEVIHDGTKPSEGGEEPK